MMKPTSLIVIAFSSFSAAAPLLVGADAGAPLPSNAAWLLVNGASNNSSSGQAEAAAVPHLTYFGGPVIANVVIQPIWYGSAKFQTNLQSFYSAVTKSGWWSVLSQYNVASGSAIAGISVPATQTALDDNVDIKPLLINMVKAGTIVPTANTYFPIHFAPGVSITQNGGVSCMPGSFCAYHGTIDISSLSKGTKYLYYGVIPDQGGNCAGGCGNDPSLVNNLFSVSSHELAEAATDPAVGVATTNAPPLGWYDLKNHEIGDICNAKQSTTVGGDGVTYVIQTMWSNSANACVAQ